MKNLIDKACRQDTKSSTYMILSALILASAILFSAWISKGSENSEAIFLILITASSSIFFIGRNKNDGKGGKRN